MEELEMQFIDPEFQTKGHEKIDFRSILMRRIERIAIFRDQDLGEFSLFDLKADIITSEHLNIIISNVNRYQNSVKALANLLVTYRDEEYKQNVKNIREMYKNATSQIINKKKMQTLKNNKGTLPIEFEEWEKSKRTELTLRFAVKEYDAIYEECMHLSKRAKYLGGDDTLVETI